MVRLVTFGLDPMTRPTSRPKRKWTTTVNFAIKEQSSNFVDCDLQPNQDSDETRTTQQGSHNDDEKSNGQRPELLMREKAEQLSYTEPHVQEKKQRVQRSNDAEHNLADPLFQFLPPLGFTDVSQYSSSNYRPRHVEEIRKTRSHRLRPHSTPFVVELPPSNPHESQAAYAITSGSGNTYHDFYPLEQHTFHSSPDTSLLENSSGHGVYRPQLVYAPQEIADFEQATHVISYAGHISDS